MKNKDKKAVSGRLLSGGEERAEVTQQPETTQNAQQTINELELFKFMVDSVSDFVGICDMNFNPFYVNKEGLQLAGLDSLEQLKNTPVADFFFPEDVDFILNKFFPRVVSTGRAETEIRFRHFKTGQAVWMIYSVMLLKDAGGNPAGFATISKNITEQKMASDKLRLFSGEFERKVNERTAELAAQKEFSQAIINTTPDLIGAYDTGLRIIEFNKACEDFFHLKKKDVIGKGYLEVFPGAYNSQGHKDLIRALRGETIYNRDFHSIVTGRHYQNSVVPLKDTEGKVYAAIAIAHDITDVTEATQTIKQNQEKFNKLFSASPLGMTLTEIPSGKIVDVNKVHLETVGYSREEYIGSTFLKLNLIDKKERKKILKRLQKNGSVKNLEVDIRKKSGEKVPVLNSIETIAIDNKKYLLSVIIDITERKKNEQEVKERSRELKKVNRELKQTAQTLLKSEERYHRMVKEVEDYAIIYLSRNGTIENWNEGAEKIKGYKEEEIIGKNFSLFYTAKDRKNKLPQKLLQEAAKNDKANHEGWRVRKDGTWFWGNILITALHDSKNNVIGFSKVTRDLTSRKNAEEAIKQAYEELRQKNQALEKMNKELETFTFVSSHDLQEPLRKIKTFAGVLQDEEQEKLSESGKDYLRRTIETVKRMQTLIDDLLTYSRMKNTEHKFEKTGLTGITREVLAEFRETIKEKKVNVRINGSCKASIIRFQFRQLIQNLLSNSLKFAHPKRPLRILIKNEIRPGRQLNNNALLPATRYCHISFTDNGIGFDPQYKNRIFEVFQRLHEYKKYKGTGIGLAICKRIVENHKGIITATGKLNKSARFDIYFPAS